MDNNCNNYNNTVEDEDALLVLFELIQKIIPPVSPAYTYQNETNFNPLYQNLNQSHLVCPLKKNDIRIWALRTDGIMATGIKNEKKFGYHGMKKEIEKNLTSLYKKGNRYVYFLNEEDRYGHPSLTESTDKVFYYAGWLRKYPDKIIMANRSGRYCESVDSFSNEQKEIIELYISKIMMLAYNESRIEFYDFKIIDVASFAASKLHDLNASEFNQNYHGTSCLIEPRVYLANEIDTRISSVLNSQNNTL